MASCCQVVPLATRPKNGIKAGLRKDQYLHHKYDTQSPFAPRKKRLHEGETRPFSYKIKRNQTPTIQLLFCNSPLKIST